MAALAGCGGDGADEELKLEDARRMVEEENSNLINQSYQVTATMLYYPYLPANGSAAPLPGNQIVLVSVTVENTGESPVVASYTDFILETGDGQEYLPELVSGLEDDFGPARSPVPGSDESGTLAFEIPETAVPVRLWEEIGPERRPVELPARTQ